MDGILPTLVSKASRSRALLGHESTRYIQSVFGSDQVESRLWNMVIRTLCFLVNMVTLPVRCSLDAFISSARTSSPVRVIC